MKSIQEGEIIDNAQIQTLDLSLKPNQTVILSKVTSILLTEPSVEDCVVIERKTKSATTELIAYIVSNQAINPEKLQSFLQDYLSPEEIPQFYIPISHVPLTSEGELDLEALLSLTVIDDRLLQQWEEKLQSIPEVDRAAVVVENYSKKLVPLHLSDLLSDRHIVNTANSTQPITSTQNNKIAFDNKSLALSYGGTLVSNADTPATLPETLQRTASQVQGEKIVFLQADGSEIRQSYADLLQEAQRILAGLRRLGLKPQDKVILQLDLNQDILAVFWGCLLGGFIPVIMAIPPSYSESHNDLDKLCHIWQLYEQPLIITTEKYQNSIQELSKWLPLKKDKISFIEILKNNPVDTNHYQSQPDDVAFFNLTSGSTGVPKSIMLTHRNILSRARGTNQLCQHSPGDIILNWLPFDHIGSISDWHLRCVELGCNLVYASKEYVLGNPLNWLNLIDKYRITHSWAPNFAYALINEALTKSKFKNNWDLSCLKTLLTAGEAVSSNVVEEFIKNLTAYQLAKTAIVPAFGMAEMGSGITYFQATEAIPVGRRTVDRDSLGSILIDVDREHPNKITFTSLGPVIPGVTIRIVNDRNQLLPEDTIGHLHVKGDAVSPGYYQNPEVNREVFLADGWFDTGDLGFISQGQLFITGRAKETIIINGANYYNGEIETVVEEVTGVEVSYTAACSVRPSGSEREQLAIFFHTAITAAESLAKLLIAIQSRVTKKVGVKPDYLIPVRKEDIPKTAIGKIQRKQLVKRFEAGELSAIVKQVDILLANDRTIPDWFYRQVWLPKKIVHQPILTESGRYLIFSDRLGLSRHISEQLQQLNQDCILIEAGTDFLKLTNDRYQLNPNNSQNYQQLLENLNLQEHPLTHIVHLWGYDEAQSDVLTQESIEATLNIGVYSLLSLTQALVKIQGDRNLVHLLVVGNHTQAATSAETIIPAKTPVLGLIKTISQEVNWLDCRHLDLTDEPIAKNIDYILTELATPQPESEIIYRNQQRLVPSLEKIAWQQKPQQELPFQNQGMYLISGGLGGIAVEIAKYLLKEYNAKLLLVGRTALPTKDTWQDCLDTEDALAKRIRNLLELQQLDGEVRYEAVDICNWSQLQTVVNQVKSDWECELDGVIHLAGIARERLFLDETKDSFAATLSPKIQGTWVLHQLLKERPHSLFISFSSINSFFGGTGTSAYTAANNFLNGFSHYQRNNCSLRSYCFAWSMWDDIGISRGYQMKELSRSKGYHTISLEQGLNSFLISLLHQPALTFIGLDSTRHNIRCYLQQTSPNLQQLNAYFTSTIDRLSLEKLYLDDRFGTPNTCKFQQLATMPLTKAGEIDRQQLSQLQKSKNAPLVAPRNEIEARLLKIWQQVLETKEVSIEDNFFALGGTSLLALRLFGQIKEQFAQDLPLATLFQAPTIAKLALILQQKDSLPSWQSLVEIQRGDLNKPPFFFVHAAGGGLLKYKKLSEYIGASQPFYGLEAQGMDGKQPIPETVEAMAYQYLQEIRSWQPHGPYYIGGLCFGGFIAFEMAQQLQAQGEEVVLLVLFNTKRASAVRRLAVPQRLIQHIKQLQNQGLKYVRNKTIGKIQWLNNKLQKKRRYAQQKQAIKATQKQENTITYENRYIPIMEAHINAEKLYQPQVYSGKIVLLRTDLQPEGYYVDPQRGWGELAGGGLEIYDIPGSSKNPLTEPHIAIQAQILKTCLEKTQSESKVI